MLEHVAEEVDKIGNDVVDRQIEHVVDERACHRKQAADHADGARCFVLRPVRVVDIRRDHADENDNTADNQHDRVERHHGIEHLLRGGQRLCSRSTDLRPVSRHRKQRKGCRSRKHQRTDDLNVVRHPVDGFEQRLQGHDRHIAGLRPDVRPGERNLVEFLVGFLCRGQQSGLDDARRQLALLRHAANFTNRHAEVIRNRLNDGRRLLEYRVQLLTTQHAGAHRLRDLEHGGGLSLCRGAGDLELLVQLLDKRDRFLIAAECVTGKQTHLRDRIRRGVVRAARTHSRLIDQLLQVGSALQTVVHQVQTRRGLRHFVRHTHDTAHQLGAEERGAQLFERCRQVLCRRLRRGHAAPQLLDFAHGSGELFTHTRQFTVKLCIQTGRCGLFGQALHPLKPVVDRTQAGRNTAEYIAHAVAQLDGIGQCHRTHLPRFVLFSAFSSSSPRTMHEAVIKALSSVGRLKNADGRM